MTLVYDKPAIKWTEALPIGNGSLGAMIFGDVVCENIQFNEESLVTGDSVTVGSYQPFGNVIIQFPNMEYERYKRELDLESALHTVNYSSRGVDYKREFFASYPDKVIIGRFSSSKLNKISMTVYLTDAHETSVNIDRNKFIITGSLPENNMQYESQLKLDVAGGNVKQDSCSIVIKDANEVILYLTANTDFILDRERNFRCDHPNEKNTKIINDASKYSYEELLNRHLDDYRNLYSRVSFSLETNNKDGLTIDQRLSQYNSEKGDPFLESLLFQYGRYLLISSSRLGSLPANLQGIWNSEKKPAWYSQYTTDINIQMNYWLAENTNLSECHMPYFDWLENMAKVQKERGKWDNNLSTKNGKGWINYCTNNIMGGASTWGVNHPGSAWMSQHFWEHYAFTRDEEFLLNRAYPLLKDLVEYWEDELIISDDNKYYLTPGGWSPEHGPGMKEGDRTLYPGISYDVQIVRDLFNNYIDAANVLNIDKEYVRNIESKIDKLLPHKIGKWGQLQEWMEDWDDPNDKHRHQSHLFAVHPGRQISPYNTPQLADAAFVSLKSRGDESTGWSTAWKIAIYARLFKSERAHSLIKSLFKNCILTNLFDSHPPFQIDGNFGYTAAVSEMLLQSHLMEDNQYVFCLLPALPSEWAKGSIKGLKARGGCIVDQEWENNGLTNLLIEATNDVSFKLIYKDYKIDVQLNKGDSFNFADLLNKII